jgi:hypothetical protein
MICIETDFVYIMLQGKYASVCICVQNPPPLTPIFLPIFLFYYYYCICLVSMQKEWRRMDSTLNHIHILTTLKLTKKQEFKKERKKEKDTV